MNTGNRKIKQRQIIDIILIPAFLFLFLAQCQFASWQKCLTEHYPQPIFVNGSQGGYYPSVIFDPDSFGENTGSAIGSGPGTYSVRPYYKMI